MLLLCALVVGSSSVWATPTTYNFANIPSKGWAPGTGGSQTINGISWTYSSATWLAAGNMIQVGSSKNPQTTAWTIQTPVSSFGTNIEITSVSISAYTTNTSANYDISVGGSSVKSGSLTTSTATYSATGLNVTSGDIIVTMTGSSTSAAMYLGNISVTYEEIPLSTTLPVTITTAEYATFCNATTALDFSGTGIKVYTATDGETKVTLNEITSGQVPANTPVVLYKAGGATVNVPVIASADAVEGTNDLRVSTGTDVANMYVLAMNPTIGFYPWAGETDLSAGRVYLQGKDSYGARTFIGFGEEASIADVNHETVTNNRYFDLQGRRVAQPTKGLYIVNGKKVVVK